MAKIKFYKGAKADLPASKTDGNIYVAQEAANSALGTIWEGNKLVGDGAANARWYAEASLTNNQYSAVLKDYTIPFEPIVGARVVVTIKANSVAGAYLQINGKGNKAIRYRGAAIAANQLKANGTYTFMYVSNGASTPTYYWDVVGDLDTNTTPGSADLTIQGNGTTAQTFSSNSTVDKNLNITGTGTVSVSAESGKIIINGSSHPSVYNGSLSLGAGNGKDSSIFSANSSANRTIHFYGSEAADGTPGITVSHTTKTGDSTFSEITISNTSHSHSDYATKSDVASIATGFHYEGSHPKSGSSAGTISSPSIPELKVTDTSAGNYHAMRAGCTWIVGTAGYITNTLTSGATNPQAVEVGDMIVYDGSKFNVFQKNVDLATNSVAGLLKVGNVRTTAITTAAATSTNNRYYAVERDSNGKAFVNIPWVSYSSDGTTIQLSNGQFSAKTGAVAQNGTTLTTGGQVYTYVTNSINNLDVSDTAKTGQYVSAVSETNGKISVSRADLPTLASLGGLASDTSFYNSFTFVGCEGNVDDYASGTDRTLKLYSDTLNGTHDRAGEIHIDIEWHNFDDTSTE